MSGRGSPCPQSWRRGRRGRDGQLRDDLADHEGPVLDRTRCRCPVLRVSGRTLLSTQPLMTPLMPTNETPSAGAVARFELYFIPEPNSGCWLWVGGVRGKGYGAFWFDGKSVQAHRFAYEAYVGPFPEGMIADHGCRVRLCVNPWHVEPVTNQENILRGIGLPSLNVLKTHCPQGHEYSVGNTVRRDGDRHCRTCR